MKKLLLAALFLFSLALGYAQFSDHSLPLPGSVRQFLDERETLTSLSKSNSANHSPALSAKYAAPQLENGIELIDAFIAVDNKGVLDVLRAKGVDISCEFDGFVTARVPVKCLAQISRLSGVKDVEISKSLDFCTDSTMSVTHAGQAIHGLQNGYPQNYDGRGVIVGIIDSGFDYKHSAFKSSKDPTKPRIVRIYDPADTTGHVVKLGDNTLKGSVFMDDQIDTLITDVRGGTHGTHVASIAAGRHVNGYGGMAPESDIVLCCSRSLNSGISETEVANCIKYIYAYADSVGKPCVINLSVSTSAGSHDGKDYLSRAIKQSVGPGRIVVVAAGNNASQAYYVHGPATKAKPMNFLVDCTFKNADDNYYYNGMSYEAWVRTPGVQPVVKFHILDKRTNKIVWESAPVTGTSKFYSSEFSEFFEPDTSVSKDGYLFADVSMAVYCSRYVVTLGISNLKSKSYYYNDQTKIISNYRLGMSVYPRSVNSCDVDCWMGSGVGRFGSMTSPVFVDSIQPDGSTVTTQIDNFYAIPDNSCSIGSYAVSDSVISVGNYIARNKYFSVNRDSLVVEWWIGVGGIYSSSSYQSPGSGITGKHLPTITAPGYKVIAACSRYSYFNSDVRSELVMRDDEGSCWGILTGTSMATPAVAGIIAQWLEVNPNLSPRQIKDVIAQTAIKDDFTYTSERFGPNGKIDAMAGIVYLINNYSDFILGDVSGDGELSVNDVTMMIDVLLGHELPIFKMVAADVSQDGEFSINDAVLLVDMLMGVTDGESPPVEDE